MAWNSVIEAIRPVAASTQAVQGVSEAFEASNVTRAVPDPAAVDAFGALMETDSPDPVPFASQVAEAWHRSQDVRQARLHRINALVNLSGPGGASARQLTELQYELINLNFQQEVVTDVAKKASSAVETLVRNG